VSDFHEMSALWVANDPVDDHRDDRIEGGSETDRDLDSCQSLREFSLSRENANLAVVCGLYRPLDACDRPYDRLDDHPGGISRGPFLVRRNTMTSLEKLRKSLLACSEASKFETICTCGQYHRRLLAES
jgi:hypothetical protein